MQSDSIFGGKARLLMRLPWSMGHDNIVRINLQPFAPPAEEIYRTVERMWRFSR